MLWFEQEVRLNAGASPADVAERLGRLVSPPFSLSELGRRKLLRGRVSAAGGVLCWPMNQYRFSSARKLEFSLLETPQGSLFQGRFRLGAALNLYAIVALSFTTLFGGWLLVQTLIHHGPLLQVAKDLGRILAGVCGVAAYVAIVVWFGKSRDGALVRVLRVALRSESGAEAVDHIFAPDQTARKSFIDDPAKPSL